MNRAESGQDLASDNEQSSASGLWNGNLNPLLLCYHPITLDTTNLTKNNTHFKKTVMESVIARTVHFWLLPLTGPKLGLESPGAGRGQVA